MRDADSAYRAARNRRIIGAAALLAGVIAGIFLLIRMVTRDMGRIFDGLHENVEKAHVATDVAPAGSRVMYNSDSVGVVERIGHMDLGRSRATVVLTNVDTSAVSPVRAIAAVSSSEIVERQTPIVLTLVGILPDTTVYKLSGTMWFVGDERRIPLYVKKG